PHMHFVGDTEMKSIINVSTGTGVFLFAPKNVRVILVVQKISQDSRKPALRGINRLGLVLGDFFAKAEMDMCIDQSRENMQALCGNFWHARSDRSARYQMCSNTAALNQQVQGSLAMLRIDDDATPQDEIMGHQLLRMRGNKV